MTTPDDKTERIDLPADVELEAPFAADEVTPAVPRACTDCGGPFMALANDAPPPGSYAEAWRIPIICRGTADPADWRWCRVTGNLNMPNRMRVEYFPDRRRGEKRVATDRRRAGPPPFPPRSDDK